MFGIGSTELLVILVVALIVLGPKSLSSVSRSLGKAMGEFRRVSTDFQRTLNVETAEAEAREEQEKRRRQRSQATTASHDSQTTGTHANNDDFQPPNGSPVAEAMARTKAEADSKKEVNLAKDVHGENQHG